MKPEPTMLRLNNNPSSYGYTGRAFALFLTVPASEEPAVTFLEKAGGRPAVQAILNGTSYSPEEQCFAIACDYREYAHHNIHPSPLDLKGRQQQIMVSQQTIVDRTSPIDPTSKLGVHFLLELESQGFCIEPVQRTSSRLVEERVLRHEKALALLQNRA